MGCSGDCKSCKEKCSSKDLREKPNRYSSVKKIIGIVSGKGGVGKSMVTALLANGIQKRGYKAGILDADITGPSIPKMFKITEKATGNEEGLFPAKSSDGVKIMSSQLLLEHDTDPVVWRGPVIAGLVKQFWTDVIWDNVDYLFVDMPPGTGDVPLTVFQSIGVDGIIIVTSPQELVGMIVEKAVKMAEMMNIPVLGLVENMSYIECPDCKKHIEVFGKSNVDAIAKRHKVKVLDKMPIDANLSKLSDKGEIEKFDKEYLKNALDTLEAEPVHVLNVAMLVNENNEIADCIHCAKNLYVFSTVKRMVIAGKMINDLSNLVDQLVLNNVHVFLANNLPDDIHHLIEEKGIEVKEAWKGVASDVIREYLVGKEIEVECDGDCAHCESSSCKENHSDCDHDCDSCSHSDHCDHK